MTAGEEVFRELERELIIAVTLFTNVGLGSASSIFKVEASDES